MGDNSREFPIIFPNHSLLVNKLASLNRKERFWLVRQAIGAESFDKLSEDFLNDISRKLSIKIPEDAWWAMDYHIDWIAAVLSTDSSNLETDGPNDKGLYDNTKNFPSDEGGVSIDPIIKGTQQDFDLIIAFENNIILCEAKGAGSWDRKQMDSKVCRIRSLLTLAQSYDPEIDIKLVLISPKSRNETKVHLNSDGSKNTCWPKEFLYPNEDNFLKPFKIDLDFGYAEKSLFRVERVNGRTANKKFYKDFRILRYNALKTNRDSGKR